MTTKIKYTKEDIVGCTKYGGNFRKEYMAWGGMRGRCYDKDNPAFRNYGARGITVCDEWLKPFPEGFLSFLNHVGPAEHSKLSIDRIDNNGNYEPGNIRWATNSQQVTNRRPYKVPNRKRGYLINTVNSTTGEKYIVKIPSGTFQVKMQHIGFSKCFLTLEEAIKVRNEKLGFEL